MKAIIWTKYGPPEGLELREVAAPIPKDRTYLKNRRLWSNLSLGAGRWISKTNNGQWLNLYFQKWNVERMAKGDLEWMIERS
jgi:hypothetical protein